MVFARVLFTFATQLAGISHETQVWQTLSFGSDGHLTRLSCGGAGENWMPVRPCVSGSIPPPPTVLPGGFSQQGGGGAGQKSQVVHVRQAVQYSILLSPTKWGSKLQAVPLMLSICLTPKRLFGADEPNANDR